MTLTSFARLTRATTLTFALVASFAAQAAVVENSLPFTNSPDWTTITFAGTSMAVNSGGTSSTLSTANNRGVWFGYYPPVDSTNVPIWAPGNSSQGNYLSLDASFSTGSSDWNAYLFDKTSFAMIAFNPTIGCTATSNSGSCYANPTEAGIRVIYGASTNTTVLESKLVEMDLTQRHSFEFLLKNGQVSYRVDGNPVFSGLALSRSNSSPQLVIGDGSGSTQTGEGSMTIYSVAFDNAPLASTLAPVPEPETWAMWLGGVLMMLAALRRQRVVKGALTGVRV